MINSYAKPTHDLGIAAFNVLFSRIYFRHQSSRLIRRCVVMILIHVWVSRQLEIVLEVSPEMPFSTYLST